MRYYLAFFATYLMLSCNSTSNSKNVELSHSKGNTGKDIFSKYCKSCHHAPDKSGDWEFNLSNLFQRLPTSSPENYFIEFVKDSRSLKRSGDEYALALAKKWNSDFEHHFADSIFSEDFKHLINYIKTYNK